jgi:hypothetical protein
MRIAERYLKHCVSCNLLPELGAVHLEVIVDIHVIHLHSRADQASLSLQEIEKSVRRQQPARTRA